MDVRPKIISTLAHAVFIYISELTPVYPLTYLYTNFLVPQDLIYFTRVCFKHNQKYSQTKIKINPSFE